jgi:hypothetical protein
MQAVGMVNDHVVECFRYQALSGERATLQRRVKKHDQYGL